MRLSQSPFSATVALFCDSVDRALAYCRIFHAVCFNSYVTCNNFYWATKVWNLRRWGSLDNVAEPLENRVQDIIFPAYILPSDIFLRTIPWTTSRPIPVEKGGERSVGETVWGKNAEDVRGKYIHWVWLPENLCRRLKFVMLGIQTVVARGTEQWSFHIFVSC